MAFLSILSTQLTSNIDCDIFWCYGSCTVDYAIFGDVFAFDTIYRTNAYHKPLVVIVGINYHYRTTIFGFTLLTAETKQTYI